MLNRIVREQSVEPIVSRYGDPHYGDPRYGDPRYGDPRYGDPRYGDPRYGDPRGHYRAWDDISLMNAMAAVDNGTSIRKAAEMYSIPRSTLHDHVSGKIAYGAKSRPSPYLTTEEEEELASFLIQAAKIGYPHTKSQVFAIVQ